eukprot:GGOE01010265.1.p1 GENE.GGOE01010265.1~~GGOE01010265.1.p1  ORF type:complete len:197 (-),score=41.69 GGOE01010265.1:1322-1885(-)
MGAACIRSCRIEPQGGGSTIGAVLANRHISQPGGRSGMYLQADGAGVMRSSGCEEDGRQVSMCSQSSACSMDSRHSLQRGIRTLYSCKVVQPSQSLLSQKKNMLAPTEHRTLDQRRSLPSATLAEQLRIATTPAQGAVVTKGEVIDDWQAAILQVMSRMESEAVSNDDLLQLCAAGEEVSQLGQRQH